EAVTQRVRRRRRRKTERDASAGHGFLNHALAERSSLSAAEQRLGRWQRPGTARDVIGNGAADHRQDRNDALLTPLAGDGQYLTERHVSALQRQRLGDTQ